MMADILMHAPWVLALLAVGALVALMLTWPIWSQRASRKQAALLSILALCIGAGLYSLIGNPIYAYQQTRAQAQLADAEAKIVTLQRALKANPKQPKAWKEMAQAYMLLGRAGMARFAALQAVALDANNPETLMDYAKTEIIASNGDVNAAAVEALQQVLTLQENPQARLFLAIYDAQQGRMDAAKAGFTQLINATTTPAEIRTNAQQQLERMQKK